jgi:tetratricopeptide (TPR) repeat protein
MSVINNMLQALDRRGAARPEAAAGLTSAAAGPGARAPLPSARWRLPAIVALGGAAIAATALADWPSAIGVPGAVPTPALPLAAAPAAAEAPPPAATVVSEPETTPIVASTASTAPAAPVAPVPSVKPIAAPLLPASLQLAPPLPARIDKRSAAGPAERAAALQREALQLAQTGQASVALERAREALRADAAHTPSRLLAAVLEHEAGANERAMALLRDGLAREPGERSFALLLARLQAAGGDAVAALATLDRHGVDDAAAQGLRAGLWAAAGDWTRAREGYDSAARQEPAQSAWWFGLGVSLDALGEGARARQAYGRALAIGLPQAEQAAYAGQRARALD